MQLIIVEEPPLCLSKHFLLACSGTLASAYVIFTHLLLYSISSPVTTFSFVPHPLHAFSVGTPSVLSYWPIPPLRSIHYFYSDSYHVFPTDVCVHIVLTLPSCHSILFSQRPISVACSFECYAVFHVFLRTYIYRLLLFFVFKMFK